MRRDEFIKMCGILGIGVPLQFSVVSCASDDAPTEPFSGKVVIIGAGAGGLSAGYLLNQQGTDFEILEASSVYGGRMKINTSFADFPIPLGAEWLHTSTSVFQEIVNDPSVQVNVETVEDGGEDRKFVNSSWYNFFEEYIVPSVSDKITYETIVSSVDYSGEKIVITTQNGQHTADKVIVSVPLKILQDGDISFTPGLPQSKMDAIANTPVLGGFKAFFEFSTKFYDEYQVPTTSGDKLYYDASFGQNTSRHILGLFVLGEPVQEYVSLSDNEVKNAVLNELDGIFSNQATPNYINHIYQNWNNEPFIKAGYLPDNADWRVIRELGQPVANKVYFAGGAYTDGNDWVSVHAAALSAKKAIGEINS